MKKFKLKTRPEKPQKPEMSMGMKALIEEAYGIFAYNLEGKLDICTCPVCISEEYVKELLGTPVKDLSRELIFEYLGAVSYDEEGYQIKHFLPRVLELCAEHEYIRIGTEINLDRCHFEKEIWSEHELYFMKRFSERFIIDVLSSEKRSRVIDNISVYLVMFQISGLEIAHLLNLDLWTGDSYRRNGLFHFEEMMYYHTSNYMYFNNSFSHNPDFNRQINEWISSREVAETFMPIIEEYYFANENMEYEEEWRMEQLYTVLEDNLTNPDGMG